MIVVAGTMLIDGGHHDAMVAAAQTVSAATRNEHGCLSYEFFADLADPSRFHVFEEWETLDALHAHLETDHIKAFGAALRACGISKSEVHRYDATNKSPIR